MSNRAINLRPIATEPRHDPPQFDERYSAAIRTSSLKSIERTTRSASDLCAAAAFASVPNVVTGRRGHPLAMALERLFVGDGRAARSIVAILADSACNKAAELRIKPTFSRVRAVDIARAVLAWHRDGRCKACGGHGFVRMANAPSLSDVACGACKGTARIDFDGQFRGEDAIIAHWLLSEVQRELSEAGTRAMACLAKRNLLEL